MNCITERAHADSSFDLLKLGRINKNWKEVIGLFIKRFAKEEKKYTNVEPIAEIEYHIRLSLVIVDVPPPIEFVEHISLSAPLSAKRLVDRFYNYYSLKCREAASWNCHHSWVVWRIYYRASSSSSSVNSAEISSSSSSNSSA